MSNRAVTVKQKPNGKWEVRWRERDRRPSSTFDRKADATAFADAIRTRLQTHGLVELDRGTMSLAEFFEEWWAAYAIPNLAPLTRDGYKRTWANHILVQLGDLELRSITPAVIEDHRAALHRAGAGDPTIVKAMGLLQGVLDRAVARGHIDGNPSLRVRKPPQGRDEEPVPLPPATVEKIRASLKRHRDRTMVSVMAYAGLRPHELRALTWTDLWGSNLRATARKGRGRRPRRRTIHLLPPLLADLAEWRIACGRPEDGPIFPKLRGNSEWSTSDWRNWERRVYQPAARAAGVTGDMRPYRLRGSFASLLLWEGRSPTYVAQQLGHSLQTLSRYYAGVMSELEEGDRIDAAEAIRRARNGRGMDVERGRGGR